MCTSSGTSQTRVRDKNFMFFNQAKDIEYWAAFQGRLFILYSLVLIQRKAARLTRKLKSQSSLPALWEENNTHPLPQAGS